MRVLAISDIHADYKENELWLMELSSFDYQSDILILGGDITDDLLLLDRCFYSLSKKFMKILFVPGNHELWVIRGDISTSLQKFKRVCEIAEDRGICLNTHSIGSLSIVPLLGWYDFSFGAPCSRITSEFMDFHACKWPNEFSIPAVAEYMIDKNNSSLTVTNETVISFSHFLPRIDVMPDYIPPEFRYIYPVLGSVLIEKQVRKLNSQIHIYGHSHVNQQIEIEGIRYINNAFGYPSETRIAKKNLITIYND